MDEFNKQLAVIAPSLALEYWKGERSIASMSPISIKNRMLANATALRHVLNMEESAVREQLKPSPILNLLRARFWELLDIHTKRQDPILDDDIYTGITNRESYEATISTLGGLSWILRPVINKNVIMNEAYSVVVSKLRQFLDTPLSLAQTLQIYKVLDTKLHGTPVKNVRMQTENRNLNLNAQLHNTAQTPAELMSEDELEQEIMKVKQAAARATFAPQVVPDDE